MSLFIVLLVSGGLNTPALAAEHDKPVKVAAKQVKRAIIHIKGPIYRFQNDHSSSILVVTPAGIIVTDPINADAAKWLKAELLKRFAKPIRYLILSHDHAGHSSGGEVFAGDGAVVIAHDRAKRAIIAEKRPTAVPDITFRRRMKLTLGGTEVVLKYVGRNHSDNSIVMPHRPARLRGVEHAGAGGGA